MIHGALTFDEAISNQTVGNVSTENFLKFTQEFDIVGYNIKQLYNFGGI